MEGRGSSIALQDSTFTGYATRMVMGVSGVLYQLRDFPHPLPKRMPSLVAINVKSHDLYSGDLISKPSCLYEEHKRA